MKWIRIVWLLMYVAGGQQAVSTAHAQDLLPGVQLPPQTRCVSEAASYHKVNPWVLLSILKVESNFNPRAVGNNPNGSSDIGMGQHNTNEIKKLARYGIDKDDLYDPCTATYVAAWHLAKKLSKFGNTWYGVATYHSGTPCFNDRYQKLLRNQLRRWNVLEGAVEKVQSMESCGFKSVSTKKGGGSSSSRARARSPQSEDLRESSISVVDRS